MIRENNFSIYSTTERGTYSIDTTEKQTSSESPAEAFRSCDQTAANRDKNDDLWLDLGGITEANFQLDPREDLTGITPWKQQTKTQKQSPRQRLLGFKTLEANEKSKTTEYFHTALGL